MGSSANRKDGKNSAKKEIASPRMGSTLTSLDITMRSSSTSYDDFDDDEDTRVAVIERIIRRQGAASAFNVTASKVKSSRKSRLVNKEE